MLAQTNARVTQIASAGSSADYDYDGGVDVPLWTGDVDGYVSEAARLVTGDGRLDRVRTDYLIVDELAHEIEVGQWVTFTDDEGTVQLREIIDVAKRAMLPGVPGSTKLYLKDA